MADASVETALRSTWQIDVEHAVFGAASERLITSRLVADFPAHRVAAAQADVFADVISLAALNAADELEIAYEPTVKRYAADRRYREHDDASEIVEKLLADLVNLLAPNDSELRGAMTEALSSLRIPVFGSPPIAFLTLVQVLQNRGLLMMVHNAIATPQSVDAPTVCMVSGASVVSISFYRRVIDPVFAALGEAIPKRIRAWGDRSGGAETGGDSDHPGD
jgi:hypothetical protein